MAVTEEKLLPNQRILVTGAGGFIGSHVVELLIKNGYPVVCLLKYQENPRWLTNLPVTIVEGDLRDQASLAHAVHHISTVIHLAGRMGGWSNPAAIEDVNVGGTRNLYQAFLNQGRNQRRFLFVSSLAATGGTPSTGIYDESWESAPLSAYGRSKLESEKYLLSQEIPVTVVRLPVVYGPRSFRGLFPIFKMGAKGLLLFTKKIHTIVGYVEDVARGIIQASQSTRAQGQVYYLGEDHVYSSSQICTAIGAAQNRRHLRIHIPYPALYATAFFMEMHAGLGKKNPLLWRRNLSEYLKHHYRFTTNKAHLDFGYQSRVSLPRGIRQTARWYRENGYI